MPRTPPASAQTSPGGLSILLKIYDCRSPYNRILLFDYAPELARRNHDVLVAARSFHSLRPPARIAVSRLGLGRHLACLDFALVGWQMAALCRRHRVDVVHFLASPAREGVWDYLALAVFRMLSKVPVVLEGGRPPWGAYSGLPASRAFAWAVSRVIVPGTKMKRELRDHHPGQDHKVRAVFNAVSGPPRPYLLSIARLARDKGIDVLLLAFADVVRRGHDVDLSLVGAFPSLFGFRLNHYQRLAQKLGIADRVHFWGHLEPPRAAQLLQGCLAFVLASRWEGHSCALLEAMAAGKAVVATDVGSAEETIEHERDGLLVPAKDPRALESALDRLIRDEALRARLGRAGRERATRDFNWSARARACEAVYGETLAPPGAGRQG